MNDENSQNDNTAFNGSFRLTVLYFVLGVLNCSGFLICCTLAKLYKQFHFNHANFSAILSNLLCCLAINNAIQYGRVFTIFIQWFFGIESRISAATVEYIIIAFNKFEKKNFRRIKHAHFL